GQSGAEAGSANQVERATGTNRDLIMKMKNRNRILAVVCSVGLFTGGSVLRLIGQSGPVADAQENNVYLLKPARVFDGESAQLHEGWAVLTRGEKIEAVGSLGEITVPAGAKVIE